MQISKRVFQGNKACQIFWKMYVCISGGKKCSFFGKFSVLCFLETPILRSVLLPYSQRVLEYLKDQKISLRTSKKWKELVVLENLRLYIMLVVIYYYMKRENYKVLKFDVNNSSYFEIDQKGPEMYRNEVLGSLWKVSTWSILHFLQNDFFGKNFFFKFVEP